MMGTAVFSSSHLKHNCLGSSVVDKVKNQAGKDLALVKLPVV